MQDQIAKYLIIGGLAMLFIGIIWYFFGEKLSFLGNLPGDIKWESGNTKVYFPIVTMIIISLLGSVIINLLRRFL